MSPAEGGVDRIRLAPGYTIPRLLNGGWQLSRGHGSSSVASDALIEELSLLVDSGLTAFDCADIYEGVEELLGRFLREYGARRGRMAASRVRIHTKLVPDLDVLPRVSKRYVERIIDRSLSRLGVERLDLVQLHWWDFDVPGYVETALWLRELQQAGKVELIGMTNFDVPRLREILAAGVRPVTHQVQYSLLDRRPENGMIDFCRDQGIRLLCYGVLAGGFLTGRHHGRPDTGTAPPNRSLIKYRLIVEEFGGWDALQELLGKLVRIAQKHGVDVANVALRYLLERPQVGAVIVGAPNARHAADNLRAFRFGLDADDRRFLDALLKSHPGPAGDVYSVERVQDGPHAAIMKYGLNRIEP